MKRPFLIHNIELQERVLGGELILITKGLAKNLLSKDRNVYFSSIKTKKGEDVQSYATTSTYPEHNTDSNECWCNPDIETVEGVDIITHKEVN